MASAPDESGVGNEEQLLRRKNMTIAEKWAGALDDDSSELAELYEAMLKEHMNKYAICDDWEYFLFADDSVYCYGDGSCVTKAELLEKSKAGFDLNDGLTRAFWPLDVPKIGDMSVLFDMQTFTEFAGDRTYFFTFGKWQRQLTNTINGHAEYTVDVRALLASENENGHPTTYVFKLRVRDYWCVDEGDVDCCDVDYAKMPPPDVGASWNNPVRWQEVVEDMESFCALVASGKCPTDSKARKAAKKAGLRITKSREKRHINQRGEYQLTDSRNIVVNGAKFELTAAAAIDYCKRYVEQASHFMLIRLFQQTTRGWD
jgi:hypothetical protein